MVASIAAAETASALRTPIPMDFAVLTFPALHLLAVMLTPTVMKEKSALLVLAAESTSVWDHVRVI